MPTNEENAENLTPKKKKKMRSFSLGKGVCLCCLILGGIKRMQLY